MRLPSLPERRIEKAKAAFIELRGEEAAVARAQEIAARPTKLWRGAPVFQMTCQADFGRGPHEQWLHESYLWALIDLKGFVCPFHR